MPLVLPPVRVEQPACPECGCNEWDVHLDTEQTVDHPDAVEVILRATGASCVCCGFSVRLGAGMPDAMTWAPDA